MRHETGSSNARAVPPKHRCSEQCLGRTCFNHQESEISIFTQTHLEGTKIDSSQLLPDEFFARLMNAGKPLIEIQLQRSERNYERGILNRMKVIFLTLVLNQIWSHAESVIGEVRRWLESRPPGAVQLHGDYTFSNVLFDDQGEVCALPDWEWTVWAARLRRSSSWCRSYSREILCPQ